MKHCTTPNAPFYNADLEVLAFAEALGVNVPCDVLSLFAVLSLAVVLGTTFAVSIIAYRMIKK